MNYPKIDGILIDLDALLSIAHLCRPEHCPTDYCCSDYQVIVDGHELEAIVGYMPLAARYARGLKSGKELKNVFQEEEPPLFSIDTNRKGECIFIYPDRAGRRFCSLHTVALDREMPPAAVKPHCCTLWPLSLVESQPPILRIHEEAFDYPCNKKRRGRRRLDKGVAGIVKAIWGMDFFNELNELIRKG